MTLDQVTYHPSPDDAGDERESLLEDYLRRMVRGTLGGRIEKLAPTTKGMPDRMVLLPGGHMELIEVKTVTGQLSPAQELWHSRAAQLGTPVTVVYGRSGITRWVDERIHA